MKLSLLSGRQVVAALEHLGFGWNFQFGQGLLEGLRTDPNPREVLPARPV